MLSDVYRQLCTLDTLLWLSEKAGEVIYLECVDMCNWRVETYANRLEQMK